MLETSPAAAHETQPSQSVGPDWSILEKLAGKYDSQERARVDRIKLDIEENPWDCSEYERKQIEVPPTLIRKFGRIAMDALGIHSKRSEERRDREAISVALRERYDEREARRLAFVEEENRRKAEAERREAEFKAWKEQQERASLERDMSTARDVFEMHRRERFHNQRTQEIAERSLNSRLMTFDRLEEEVLSENPEIGKRSIPYGDGEVPVYDLRGVSFVMLTHTVDYRSANKPGEIGTETYHKVMDDPAVWSERRDEAERADGFGTRNGDARGDTISTSYTNSERNFDSRVSGELIYGFDHVDADSILSVTNGDGGTSNMAGRSETSVRQADPFEELEGAGGTGIYNEVLLRLYSVK